MTWNPKKLKTPTLIMQAGDEKYVDNAAQSSLCRKARSCETFSYGAELYRDENGQLPRHELWMEIDPIRDDVMNRTLHYLQGLGVNLH